MPTVPARVCGHACAMVGLPCSQNIRFVDALRGPWPMSKPLFAFNEFRPCNQRRIKKLQVGACAPKFSSRTLCGHGYMTVHLWCASGVPLQYMLTDAAKRLLFSPNAGGSSENSEAVSAEVLEVRVSVWLSCVCLCVLGVSSATPNQLARRRQICLGAHLLYTETEVVYDAHSSIMDYVSIVGDIRVRPLVSSPSVAGAVAQPLPHVGCLPGRCFRHASHEVPRWAVNVHGRGRAASSAQEAGRRCQRGGGRP